MKKRECAVALNARPVSVKRTIKLRDGDEVALIPPISGGRSSFIDVRITKKKIVIEDAVASVQGEGTGAVVVFIGRVRSPSKGRKIVALEYDVYERMAVGALRAIADEACDEFGVVGLSIVHRVGRVRSGETVLAIAVSSVHRDEAFKASRYVIEELKERVPIWKKEIYDDGEEWVEGKVLGGKKG
jgi:molybdopterin synthase catalytic subunit